ncbi:MAG: hypothetical protein IJS62_00480 [Bacteroidales bacterium]|nr:hypothetical protein [Bacteroidales bacterium]
MRKNLFVVLILLAGCASGPQVPSLPAPCDVVEEIRREPDKAGSLMYLYDYSHDAPLTASPKGYRPFYISHIGRHGARYSFGAQYDTVYCVLSRASAAGLLTERGARLFSEYKAFYDSVRVREGDLSLIGMEEQRVLADRLFRRFPEVFRGQTRGTAIATTVPRVMLSMSSFVDALQERDRTLSILSDASEAYSAILRPPFSAEFKDQVTPPAEASAPSIPYFRETVDMDGILRRIFTVPSATGMDEVLFLRFLFVLSNGMKCLDRTPSALFEGIFTPEDRLALARADWYRLFLFLGRYEGAPGEFVNLASHTLRDIIGRADEDMVSGNMQLRLRFSHDSFVMPLVVYMNLDGYGRTAHSPEEAFEIYPCWEMPMGGSVQFIFYRNARRPGDILLKVLLNEREAALPFESVEGPYYRWSDFKAYYQ